MFIRRLALIGVGWLLASMYHPSDVAAVRDEPPPAAQRAVEVAGRPTLTSDEEGALIHWARSAVSAAADDSAHLAALLENRSPYLRQAVLEAYWENPARVLDEPRIYAAIAAHLGDDESYLADDDCLPPSIPPPPGRAADPAWRAGDDCTRWRMAETARPLVKRFWLRADVPELVLQLVADGGSSFEDIIELFIEQRARGQRMPKTDALIARTTDAEPLAQLLEVELLVGRRRETPLPRVPALVSHDDARLAARAALLLLRDTPTDEARNAATLRLRQLLAAYDDPTLDAVLGAVDLPAPLEDDLLARFRQRPTAPLAHALGRLGTARAHDTLLASFGTNRELDLTIAASLAPIASDDVTSRLRPRLVELCGVGPDDRKPEPLHREPRATRSPVDCRTAEDALDERERLTSE